MTMSISLRSYLVAGITASVLSGTMLVAPAAGHLAQPSELDMPPVSAELSLAGVELPYPYPAEISGLVDVLAYNMELHGVDPSSFSNFGDFFLQSLGAPSLTDFIGDVPFALYETNDQLFTELDSAGLGVMSTVAKKLYSGELPRLDETLLGVASLGVYSNPGPQGVALAAFMDTMILGSTVPLGFVNRVALASEGLGGAQYLLETLPATVTSLVDQAEVFRTAFTAALKGGDLSAVAQAVAPMVATIRQLSAEFSYISAHLAARSVLPGAVASPLLDTVDPGLRSVVKLLSGSDIRPAESAPAAPAAAVPAAPHDRVPAAVAPVENPAPITSPALPDTPATKAPADVRDTVRAATPSSRAAVSPVPEISLPELTLSDIKTPAVAERPSQAMPKAVTSVADAVKDATSSIAGAVAPGRADPKPRAGTRGSRAAE